jgi:prepilin-type processing-associated H-X9-DG protein
MSIAGLILGIACIVIVIPLQLAIMLPSLNRARAVANRVACASNMRMISTALTQYASANGNVYPPDFNPLLNQGLVTAHVLECPALGPSSSGASPYVLVANHPMPANAVILYEPVADHKDGANMLFGDGSVQFIPSPRAQNVISDLQSGINPPVH